MPKILYGAPVAESLRKKSADMSAKLRAVNITPVLAIIRVGSSPDDISYERAICRRCESVGAEVKLVLLDETVTEREFLHILRGLSADDRVHGILMLRPLPKHISDIRARAALAHGKDVDGCTDMSLAGVFIHSDLGFPPCTAQAVMEMIRYYRIDIDGKRVAILGRSLVTGRPLAMMMMHANATVTICHTHTPDPASIAREADIIVSCTGRMHSIGAEYFMPGQIVIDVGVNWDPDRQQMMGDVAFDEAEKTAAAVTPVPGGIGAVTTQVLVDHVITAAYNTSIVND